jgi:hypothetical protein
MFLVGTDLAVWPVSQIQLLALKTSLFRDRLKGSRLFKRDHGPITLCEDATRFLACHTSSYRDR